MEDGGSLFSPDFLTPSQWHDIHRAAPDGIKRLMLALLEVSLRDATGQHSTKSRGRRRKYKSTASQRERALAKHSQRASALRRDARTWIFGDGDGPFSFTTCCETLEIDGAKLRERIRGRSGAQRSLLSALVTNKRRCGNAEALGERANLADVEIAPSAKNFRNDALTADLRQVAL